MNLLEFELVVSVVAVAVVLDLVWTRDVLILVPVSVHLVSPVVLVLDEIALVMDPFLIDVLVAHVRRLCRWLLLCQILLSRYTMFGALIGIVSSDSHQHLSQFSLAGDAIRSCSFAHLIAVAR